MKALKILKRLAQYKLDEKRISFLAYSHQYQALQNNLLMLQQNLEAEENLARNQDPQFALFFYFFQQNVQRQCELSEASKEKISLRMEKIQDEVLEVFQEKKSYEITLKLFENQKKKLLLQQEQNILDEISSQIIKETPLRKFGEINK